MRNRYAVAVAVLTVAALLFLRPGVVQGQYGPSGSLLAGGVFLGDVVVPGSVAPVSWQLPVGRNLIQVQLSSVAYTSPSSVFAYVDIYAITHVSSVLLYRYRSVDPVSLFLRLPSGVQTIQVSWGGEVSMLSLSVYAYIVPDAPFATYPDASQCQLVQPATELTSGVMINLASTGVILVGRLSFDYRSTYYVNSPGPLVYEGFLPRLSSLVDYGQYNTLGPLPSGQYELVVSVPLAGVYYAVYECDVQLPDPGGCISGVGEYDWHRELNLPPSLYTGWIRITDAAGGSRWVQLWLGDTMQVDVPSSVIDARGQYQVVRVSADRLYWHRVAIEYMLCPVSSIVMPTVTPVSSTSTLLHVEPLRVTPIVANPMHLSLGASDYGLQCTQIVPSFDLGIPGTDVQFSWPGFSVCQRRFGFSLALGDLDLVPLLIGVFSVPVLWAIWQTVRRG